jgi:hypothetical protein
MPLWAMSTVLRPRSSAALGTDVGCPPLAGPQPGCNGCSAVGAPWVDDDGYVVGFNMV